ncbi:hypothetical protein [Kitasatospora sp. NPDC091276]|uniref:hypothetical protein n=1 Tax=Kitasatospora sp. NPDC091276 TaxID=3155300 RepID=UPI00342B1B4B
MPSFASDSRHQKLVGVLIPLLRRACPPDAGGYGGAYELRLSPGEAEELGGLELIQSAMRKAARELGWSKPQTCGTTTTTMALAVVVDQREVPEEFASAVERHERDRMREAAEAVSRRITSDAPRAVRGSVFVTTQEFRAAYAAARES